MQSSYARFIIDALSSACPKSAYFRMYIEKSEPHNDYEALADKPNVESMEPDGIIWRKLSGLWRIWHVGKDMERGDVELYHALAGLLPFGLERRNIRSVVTVHNLEFLRLRRHFSSIYNFYRRAIMLSSMRRADRIIAASECVKRDLIRYLHIDSEKIDVIYGGCHRRFSEPVTELEMERVKERYNLPERYLLVAGKHNARKNLIHIIETLPQMESDVNIVIVGRGTMHTEALVRKMKALGVFDIKDIKILSLDPVKANVKDAYLYAFDLDGFKFEQYSSFGITAGASTPNDVIEFKILALSRM